MAFVNGTAGDDTLSGTAAADSINGLAGDDILKGLAGADAINGGDGSDFANYQDSAAGVTIDLLAGTGAGGSAEGDTLTSIENIYASAFDDHLTGDDGRNIIGGWTGNDTIAGHGGDDVLAGEAGDDDLSGGDGNDRLVGADGIDTIHGGIGNDSIDGGAGNDQVFGEDGNDSITGGTGDDHIDGGAGNDIIEADGGADAIIGGGGTDTASYITSTAGVTVDLAAGTGLGGDAEGDTLTGIEQIYGSNLADHLTGDAGDNQLWGADGDDVLTGGAGADLFKGGAGSDLIFGEAGDDIIMGGDGADQIDGGAGNDYIVTGTGADTIDGGEGVDTLSYAGSSVAVQVILFQPGSGRGDAAGDTWTGIERVVGTDFNDVIGGLPGGDNTIWGGAGDDAIRGYEGADLLKGGAGNDTFGYGRVEESTVAASGRDTIADFATGDIIQVRGIDADGNAANGDTAFTFGTGGFTGHAGELRVVDFGDGRMSVNLDIDGDKSPDSIINVVSDHALTASDFVL